MIEEVDEINALQFDRKNIDDKNRRLLYQAYLSLIEVNKIDDEPILLLLVVGIPAPFILNGL